MKKIFLLILLFIPLVNGQQGLTLEEINDFYITPLDSTYDLSGTIDDIMRLNLIEALPKLEQNFWNQNCLNQQWFLKALVRFNSSLAHEYCLSYLDSLNTQGNEKYNDYTCCNILDTKVDVIELLYKLNDFSKVDEVFELIESDKAQGISYSYGIDLLPYIYKHRPDYKTRAKQEMMTAMNNAEDEYAVFAYSLDLAQAFGEEEIPEMVQLFKTITNPQAKRGLLEFYFSRYEDKFDLDGLVKETLSAESNSELRLYLVKVLLLGFATPSDYEFVKNYYQTEPNDTIKSLIKFEVETFQPPPIDSTKSILEYISDLTDLSDSIYFYSWISDLAFKAEIQSILQSASINIQNRDSLACRSEIKSFQDTVDYVYADSLNPDPRFVTLEGWKFLHWNAQYILDRLPEPHVNPNLVVKLTNSQGVQIPASNVKYYDTSWKDAVDNGDGTFTVITTKPNVSVRVFYEGANQTVNNVPAQNNTFTFHTVNTQVELENSAGTLIDEGTVKYYAGAWRDFGTTVNGVASKELLPVNYSFRMTYEYGGIDKQQNISVNPTVVFQTVNAAVELRNSLGNLIDEGTVLYYSGAWRSFGSTVNGVAYKELLPKNYSFRMTYEYVSNDKQQDLNTNPVVTFSTVLCTVQVRNQQNQPVNDADVKYYSGAWREIGLTNANGEITKELLPANLSFRATLGTFHQDVQQDLSDNNLVQIILPIQ
jgi:hypothetical protein